MGIVFDEVVTEIIAPSTEKKESEEQQDENSSPSLSDAEIAQSLEFVRRRQLRLIAD